MSAEKDVKPAAPRPAPRGAELTAAKLQAAGLGAVAVLTCLAYLCGARPLLERHDLALRQQADLTAARAKWADTQRAWAALQQKYADARQALAASPLRLLPGSALNQRLALLTDLASQGGVGVDDVQPGKNSGGVQYDSMPIHLAGAGSFPAVTALLHRLRGEFPDTAVTTFEIFGSPQDPGGGVSARFTVDLLWYTEPTTRSSRAGRKGVTP